jgi:flagellin-like protein
MMSKLSLNRNDDAISPVIGTILMVAATVIIAGAVYAAVNAYNGKSSDPTPDAAFKATTVDTGATPNGAEDTIKVTYLSGSAGSASIVVKKADGTTATSADGADAGTDPDDCASTLTSAGSFMTCDPLAGAGTYYVVVAIGDQTLLDQTMTLKE